MNESTMNNMEQRLDRLERENLRWRRIGFLVLVVIAAVVLMGQAKPSKVAKVIEAEEIIIRDKNKQIRVSISSLGIHVLNAEEVTSVFSDGITLGTRKLRLMVLSNTSTGPSLSLVDRQGNIRALLGASLEMTGTGTVTRRAESSLALFDQKGEVIWRAP